MNQNPHRSAKIFTTIVPSSLFTQIVSSQANINLALQLFQPVMAPQTYASQVVVPQVKSVVP